MDRYKAADSGCSERERGELGTCGALKYVAQHDGYAGHTEYFDHAGTLVAADRSSDTNSYCNGKSFGAQYGTRADCTRVVANDLCSGMPRQDGL
jgi:hypothetical protein